MLCDLAFSSGNRVEQRTFLVAKQRLVNVRAQLLVAQVVRASVRSGQIVERLSLLLAGGYKRAHALHEHDGLFNAHGEHGVDGVGGSTLVFRHDLRARDEEVDHISANGGGVELNTLSRIARKRHVNGGTERNVEALIGKQHSHNAQRAAAQRERVGRARGALANGEQAANSVELVGDGHDAANAFGRHIVARETRTVVVGDGTRHGVGLAGSLGVVAAHDALHAREFHNRARDQVGLGQIGGALGVGGFLARHASVGGDGLGERNNAIGLGARGAKLFLEHDGVEAFNVIFERALQVFVVEELRVVKASSHDALVAVDDVRFELRIAIRGDKELIRKRSIGVEQREIALVHKHGVNSDFLRNRQEQLVELAHHNRGELGEVHDFSHGLRGKLGHKARLLFDSRDLLANGSLALGLGGHHVVLAKHIDKSVGRSDLPRAGC